jgi:hypothetical protein
MFYDSHYSFPEMVMFWLGVTTAYGVSLHLALRLARVELEFRGQIFVILVSSLAALLPAIGPYLAFVIAGFLIYRLTDSTPGVIIGVVAVTPLLAVPVGFLAIEGLAAVGLLKG